jgi:adenylate cyclase
MFLIAASIELKVPFFSKQVWDKYVTFFFSITHISTLVQLGFSLLLSLIYSEVSENLGQNVLYNFFTGKYHKPIVEQRLFMFTDMYASTTIAEQLGSVAYFEFLRCYYNDLSDAIIRHYGEVYQYIGDEIVMSWNLNKPEAYNNSVNCFFAMKHNLIQKRDWYLKRFGVFPEFKGAIHCGEVTIGEIGALKKEIFFTGDVLNTTARIQALCTKYKTDLLLSEDVVSHWKVVSDYECKRMDTVILKGKKKALTLYTISKRLP